MPGLQKATVPPETDTDTAWWWTALEGGTLLIPHCPTCGRDFFPPMPSCPHCGGIGTARREHDGRGSVYSWIVVHHAFDPAFAEETPYTVIAVQLTGGARLFGRITNGPIAAGTPVRAVPYRVGTTTLLGFERT